MYKYIFDHFNEFSDRQSHVLITGNDATLFSFVRIVPLRFTALKDWDAGHPIDLTWEAELHGSSQQRSEALIG